MSARVGDMVRLAWRAGAGGRPGMRDALLTLVVAESGADDAVLAERCRRLLVRNRPGHCFSRSATLGHALTRPRVKDALRKLRWMYPPARVRHLLLRAEAARGPYAGPALPLDRVVEDLAVDLRPALVGAAGRPERQAVPFPAPAPTPVGTTAGGGGSEGAGPEGQVAIFYLSVLLAIAVLLNSVLRPAASGETKAA